MPGSVQGPPAAKRLVLMHIPRTGGTTLRHHLDQGIPAAERCPERFSELYRYAPEALGRWRFFAGHFRRDQVLLIPGETSVVTVLRDPRARILSLRRFWRRVGASFADPPPGPRVARETGLVDFLRSREPDVVDGIDNQVARYLAGLVRVHPKRWVLEAPGPRRQVLRAEVLALALAALARLEVIGFTDALEAALAAICDAWELPPPAGPLARRHARDEPRADLADPTPEEPVPPEAEAEIARLTELDRAVLAAARAMLRPGERAVRRRR